MDVDSLYKIMVEKGLTKTESLGDIWAGNGITVIIGANEIVITSSPSIHRRFNRAVGGLVLAIEHLVSLK